MFGMFRCPNCGKLMPDVYIYCQQCSKRMKSEFEISQESSSIKKKRQTLINNGIKNLGSGLGFTRNGAVNLLRCLSDLAVEPVIAAIDDENPTRRRKICEVLEAMDDERAERALNKLSHDKNKKVKHAADKALKKKKKHYNTQNDIEQIDKNGYYQEIDSLVALGEGKNAVLPLLERINDPDKKIRLYVIGKLGNIGDQRASGPIVKALDDPDPDIQFYAINALKKIDSSKLPADSVENIKINDNFKNRMEIQQLVDDLHSRNSNTRNAAVNALVHMGASVFGMVIIASENDNATTRRKSCDILGLMGDPRGVARLNQLITDNDRFVRRRAADALIKIGDKSSVPTLINALNDNEDKVRERSARALGRIRDPKAIKPLERIIKIDQNLDVRKSALTSFNIIKKAEEDKVMNPAISAAHNGDYKPLVKIYLEDNDRLSKKAHYELLKRKIAFTEELKEYLQTNQKRKIRYKAASTLREIGISNEDVIHTFITLMKNSDDIYSTLSQEELIKIGEPSVESLIEILQSQNRNERSRAVFTLTKINSPQANEPLINALIKIGYTDRAFDTAKGYNFKAKKELIKMGKLAVEPLIANLNNPLQYVRREIALTLMEIGLDSFETSPDIINAFIDVLISSKDEDSKKAQSVLITIGKLAVEQLIKNLETNDVNILKKITFTLTEINSPQAKKPLTTALIKILIDSNEEDNELVKKEIIKIGEPAVEPLINELSTSDALVHKEVAFTLAELDSPKAAEPLTEALIKILIDSNQEYDNQAQKYLIKIGDPAVKHLKKCLDTSDEDTLRKVTNTLIKINNPDAIESVIGALIKLLINSNDKFSKEAQEELIQIGEPAVKPLISKMNRLRSNKYKVAFTLTEIKSPNAVEPLTKALIILLQEPKGKHKERAREELIKIGEPAVPLLTSELETSEMDYLIKVAFTLTEINSPDSMKKLIEPLIKILTYWDKESRDKAKDELIKIGEPAVEPLIKTLDGKPSFGREDIEESLLEIGNKKGLAKVEEIRKEKEIDNLIKNLDLKNRDVSINSLDKLVMIGKPAVPALIKALKTSNVNIKEGAVLALGKIGLNTGDGRAVKHLIPLMHEDIGLYGQAARDSIVQIGELSVPMLLDALEESYDDEHVDTVLQGDIARALCEIRDPRAVDPLIKLLKNTESAFLSKWVSDTLYLLGEPVIEPLIKALEDPNDNLSLSAANALKFIGDPRALPPLIKLMNDSNRISRKEYALTLGYIGDNSSIEPLIKALDDQDDYFSNAVASSIVNIGQASVEPLITAIKNSKENPYYHGILMGIGMPAFDSITELLNHQDWEIRNQALLDIVQIDPNKSFWYLITALKDDNETIRKNAAGILGAAADTRAINPLMDTLKDPDVEVRNAAAKALNRIEERKPILHDEPESIDELNDYPLIPKGEISISNVHQMGREKDIEGLIRALTSEDKNVSFFAKIKLVDIGKPALDKLVKAKNDSQNRDYIYYIGDAIDYITMFNKDVSWEDVDQITEEQGRIPHSKIDKMVKQNDIQGLVNLLRYSDDFSEHDLGILATVTVNLGRIGSPAVYPIINFMIDHKGEDLRGPILAIINMEQRGVDCLIKLLDHYDDDVVNISMNTLKVIYQDDPAGLNNILRKKRSSDLDDLDYDFYDDPNTVTLNANELDELISREDFKTSTRRLTDRLIDENDDYMDDIIAGLYGKK